MCSSGHPKLRTLLLALPRAPYPGLGMPKREAAIAGGRVSEGAVGVIRPIAGAVYGDWPLLPAAGPPSTRRDSLVARIRDRWRGGSAISALENALEIVRAYATTSGRDAA
jgi:hypothetical protein